MTRVDAALADLELFHHHKSASVLRCEIARLQAELRIAASEPATACSAGVTVEYDAVAGVYVGSIGDIVSQGATEEEAVVATVDALRMRE